MIEARRVYALFAPAQVLELTLEEKYHDPVMVEEVLRALDLRSGARVLDCNLGGGGHSLAILRALPADSQVIGIDCDAEALVHSRQRLATYPNFRAYQGNFGRLETLEGEAAAQILPGSFTGILMDLGVSSAQLDRAERGFSFRWDAPLDMRMDSRLEQTAADILQEADEFELVRIFRHYGEEARARPIARRIVMDRVGHPLSTTGQLAELVKSVVGPGPRHHHPATKVFQALRIAVNDELGNLERGLASLLGLLAPGGRWAVLTYHSLEDRLVKNFFRDHQGRCVCPRHLPVCMCSPKVDLKVVSGGGQTASDEEVARNPRSRSARLRVAVKL